MLCHRPPRLAESTLSVSVFLKGEMMRVIREKGAKTLLEEHLRERGWNLTDFATIQKGYKLPSGREADYVFLLNENPVAILEEIGRASCRERVS
jgi:hypothetical protein